MLGECVISSVLSYCSKNLKQQIIVTAWLQLSFIWKAKENTSSRHEGRLTEKKRGAQFWLLFLYVFFLLPLSLPYVNWASQEGCLFYLRYSLWSLDLSLFHFCGLFPSLSFSHHHSGLFSYSNCLTFPPQEMGGTFLWEKGHQDLSGYFLLNWDCEGHWATHSC